MRVGRGPAARCPSRDGVRLLPARRPDAAEGARGRAGRLHAVRGGAPGTGAAALQLQAGKAAGGGAGALADAKAVYADKIIDGKQIASEVRAEVKVQAEELAAQFGVPPGARLFRPHPSPRSACLSWGLAAHLGAWRVEV
jgi:hypothetical protein